MASDDPSLAGRTAGFSAGKSSVDDPGGYEQQFPDCDRNDDVRLNATWALGEMGRVNRQDPAETVQLDPAVESLIAALDDPNWRVAEYAGIWLGRLGDPRVLVTRTARTAGNAAYPPLKAVWNSAKSARSTSSSPSKSAGARPGPTETSGPLRQRVSALKSSRSASPPRSPAA